MDPSTSQFDFDAMLMYGFVTDADLHVCEVNQSLQRWMSESEQESVNVLLGRLRRRESPALHELIDTLLDTCEAGAGEFFCLRLRELGEVVEQLNRGENIPSLLPRREGEFITRRVLRNVCDPNRILLAVRIVKPGGIQMVSGNLSDRMDFVGVCIVSRESTGSFWKVKGYQGQLQEAWLRLEPMIRRGNQTAAVALMSRNLSHNIGSHALFWLCQDEEVEKRRLLYAYLRDRMELLGSIATFMPLAFTTWGLRELLNDFSSNTEFITRICKSEQVNVISVQCDKDVEVALPGGHAGVHLLYSILENTIRDSAKYAHASSSKTAVGELKIRILVDLSPEEECNRRFVRLTVCDDRGNFSDAQEVIQSALDNLRIVDEAGNILHGAWGVKERFVCAVLLRGKQLEQIPLTQVKSGAIQDTVFSDYHPPDEPSFLSIGDVDGNLGWSFNLLRPTPPVLLIDSHADEHESHDQVEVQTFEWLQKHINEVATIRHRFVIVRVSNESDVEWLRCARERLPRRLFLMKPNNTLPTLPGVPILPPCSELAGLSDLEMQRLWTEHLLMTKGQATPVVVLGGAYDNLTLPTGLAVHALQGDDFPAWYKDNWSPAEHPEDTTPLIFTRYHIAHFDSCTEDLLRRHKVFHYEPHVGNDMLRAQLAPARIRKAKDLELLCYRLVEAALIRILIVDERIDASIDRGDVDHQGVFLRTLLGWKGVEVYGQDYGKQGHVRRLEPLMDILDKKYYDALIIHMGIAEKIARDSSAPVLNVYRRLREHCNVGHLVVHSGRPVVVDLPAGTSFMLLSNVLAWIEHSYSKMQMVEELFSLRTVQT